MEVQKSYRPEWLTAGKRLHKLFLSSLGHWADFLLSVRCGTIAGTQIAQVQGPHYQHPGEQSLEAFWPWPEVSHWSGCSQAGVAYTMALRERSLGRGGDSRLELQPQVWRDIQRLHPHPQHPIWYIEILDSAHAWITCKVGFFWVCFFCVLVFNV